MTRSERAPRRSLSASRAKQRSWFCSPQSRLPANSRNALDMEKAMAEADRLSRQEWQDLEPLLAAADRATHEGFLRNPEAAALMGESAKTPGYLLLEHLKELGDDAAVRLFRAMEMYHHEITRADITAAYLRGKELGRAEREED
jgi:hypothetical protein